LCLKGSLKKCLKYKNKFRVAILLKTNYLGKVKQNCTPFENVYPGCGLKDMFQSEWLLLQIGIIERGYFEDLLIIFVKNLLLDYNKSA